MTGLMLLVGCSAQDGGVPTQTPPSASKESRSAGNLKVEYDPKVWTFPGTGSGPGVEETFDLLFQGNGLNCQEVVCPRLVILKLAPSESAKLYDLTSGTLPPCKDGSGKVHRMPSNDITVGGLKAEYYSSDSCDQGGRSNPAWVVQEQRLVVTGERMKDGYFPTEEVGRLLAAATWVK